MAFIWALHTRLDTVHLNEGFPELRVLVCGFSKRSCWLVWVGGTAHVQLPSASVVPALRVRWAAEAASRQRQVERGPGQPRKARQEQQEAKACRAATPGRAGPTAARGRTRRGVSPGPSGHPAARRRFRFRRKARRVAAADTLPTLRHSAAFHCSCWTVLPTHSVPGVVRQNVPRQRNSHGATATDSFCGAGGLASSQTRFHPKSPKPM